MNEGTTPDLDGLIVAHTDCGDVVRQSLERLHFGIEWLLCSVPGALTPEMKAAAALLEREFVGGLSAVRALEAAIADRRAST